MNARRLISALVPLLKRQGRDLALQVLHYPVPPPRLRTAVAGVSDLAWFLEGGRRGAATVERTLARQGLRLADFTHVLDFGVGCGRVMRYWRDQRRPRFYGVDYNPALIAWCQRHLRFARYQRNQLAPPLDFPAGFFDLVYAFSVFTHWPEPLQHAWMAEFRRLIRPGGYFILTTHGAHYLSILTEAERARFLAGELVVRSPEAAGRNECGAMHPEQYVRERMAAGFTIVDFVPEGALGNPWQDLYLLQRE